MKTTILETNEVECASVYTSIHPKKSYTFSGEDLIQFVNNEIYRVIDRFPVSIYWKDVTGKILGCNQFIVKLSGYTHRDELIGKTDYDFLFIEEADRIKELDQLVMEKEEMLEMEETVHVAKTNKTNSLSFF